MKISYYPAELQLTRSNPLKSWFLKWDKPIATITFVTIVVALVILVFYHVGTSTNIFTTYSQKPVSIESVESQTFCQRSTFNPCEINCSDHIENIVNDLNLHYLNFIQCPENLLNLNSVSFDNWKLSKTWLQLLQMSFSQISIQDTDLVEIEPEALAGVSFIRLHNLKEFSFLKTESFRGAVSLKHIEIEALEFDIEEDIFSEISDIIESFKCINCGFTEKSLKNISGRFVKELTHLKSLNLMQNEIEAIDKDTLCSVPNLQILYLNDNKIKSIMDSSFEKLTSIRKLDLSDNYLESLPLNLFDNIISTNAIAFANNRFNCNCDFAWFKDYYKENEAIFADLFQCYTESGYRSYKEIDFCPSSTFSYDANSGCRLSNDRCGIECKNSKIIANFSESIKEIIPDLDGCDEKTLTLESVDFTNSTIEQNWLGDIGDFKFTKLIITKTFLNEISGNAFNENALSGVKSLTFSFESGSMVFKKEAFSGTILEKLTITNTPSFEFEEDVFKEIAGYLDTFQCEVCGITEELLRKITGPLASQLSQLITLDLRSNNIAELKNDTLLQLPKIKQIYLSNNIIKQLHANAFNAIESVQTLDISSNKLETLPNNVFYKISHPRSVSITQNPFNCNCEFEWFRKLYESVNIFADTFLCYVGSAYVNYKKVDFCPNGNTTTTPTGINTTAATITAPSTNTTTTSSNTKTTIATPTTTTQIPDSLLRTITCNPSLLVPNSEQYTIQIEDSPKEINFIQIGDSSDYNIKIYIRPNETSSSFNLLWIDSHRNIECFKSLNEHSVISLSHSETYTVCLKQDSMPTVSPHECASLTVPPAWDAQTWLPNGAKLLTIAGFSVSLLMTALVSAIIMFYCVRQNPSLIKGNKRVIIVRNKSPYDATISQQSYSHRNYVPPSLHSRSDGYLTPYHKYYENINDRESVLSTISAHNDFVNVRSPMQSPTMRRYHRNLSTSARRRVRLDRVVLDDNLYEPPPLPPNHPCNLRRESEIYRQRFDVI